MSQYSTYQKFFSPEQAEPVLTVLKENGIPFQFSKCKTVVDNVIGGDTSFDNLYELKISENQFEEVNQLLRQKLEINLSDVESDYYLFSFTDVELKEILRKPDEWSNQDFGLARQILQQRGIVYSEEELKALKNERVKVLSRPERVNRRLLYGGYAAAFFFSLIGIFVGLAIWQTKKTLPNGKKEFIYDYMSRGHGKLIFIFSIVMLVVGLIFNINALAGLIGFFGSMIYWGVNIKF